MPHGRCTEAITYNAPGHLKACVAYPMACSIEKFRWGYNSVQRDTLDSTPGPEELRQNTIADVCRMHITVQRMYLSTLGKKSMQASDARHSPRLL